MSFKFSTPCESLFAVNTVTVCSTSLFVWGIFGVSCMQNFRHRKAITLNLSKFCKLPFTQLALSPICVLCCLLAQTATESVTPQPPLALYLYFLSERDTHETYYFLPFLVITSYAKLSKYSPSSICSVLNSVSCWNLFRYFCTSALLPYELKLLEVTLGLFKLQSIFFWTFLARRLLTAAGARKESLEGN